MCVRVNIFLFAGILCTLHLLPNLHALSVVDDSLQASAALLVDGSTGRVLYARNPDQQYQPASTIKLLTALVVAEQTALQGHARVNTQDIRISTPGASMANLRNGSSHSVMDLTRALLVRSFNDVASVLAAHVAGTEQDFVRMMQARARELGARNTTVTNPHGLPDAAQLTTARDLMLIFRRVIANPTLRQLCETSSGTLQTLQGPIRYTTTNRLLSSYAGMGPAKTGYTRAARHTYAASATRGGRELHLVLLDSPNKWADARLLFDHGFSLLGVDPSRSTGALANSSVGQPSEVVRRATLVRKPKPDEVIPFEEYVQNTQRNRNNTIP